MPKLSELTADTSVAGTEKLVCLDGTTPKTVTVDYVVAYAIDELLTAAAATPTTGDYLLGFRGSDEKSYTLNGVSTYAVDYVFGSVSALTPITTGDKLLVERSGTQYYSTVDTLMTYVFTGTPTAKSAIQLGVLDTSGLDTATLGATDLFTVCQTTTAKKVALSAVETKLWADFATYAAALTVVATPADADKMYILQSGVPKHITLTLLSDYVVAEILASNDLTSDILDYLPTYVAALDAITVATDADMFYAIQSGTGKYITLADISAKVVADIAADSPWTEVSSSKYTTTPASTSTITMSDTSDFAVGYPVKYTISGTAYYGIVTAVNANALLTIAGASLSSTISALYVGKPERVIVKHFFADTAFGDAVQDIGATVTLERMRWEHADAYLVAFSGTSGYADTGASEPKINVKVAGNVVGTEDTSKGITLSGTAGTWTASSAVAISTSYYDIVRGDAYDVRCTEAGTNGDAECLAVEMVFVLE